MSKRELSVTEESNKRLWYGLLLLFWSAFIPFGCLLLGTMFTEELSYLKSQVYGGVFGLLLIFNMAFIAFIGEKKK